MLFISPIVTYLYLQINMQSDVGSLAEGITRNLAAAWGGEIQSEVRKGY